MANAIFWSNVGVDVQTALGAAITISAISKAATAVATYAGSTAPTVGDYIAVTANGMYQVSDRIFRVANVNTVAKTFELEGEDSTSYDSFASGSFQVITFGASFANLQNINVSGGEPEFADVTTIHDNVRKRVPTIVSPLSLSMDAIYDLSDAGFVECNKAYRAKAKRAIRLRFGTGAKMVLTGYASASGVPTGQAQGVVQTKVSIEAQNMPTVYAA
ncbi:phage tail tube protein [Curvibacter sp. HBC28]|uniref:Phage tail tube protein n=1 Tax=Curvibacter microcysteis TaxID=3026419 RepID=A0ABT5MLD9_9BURK|nr:phage tail tube protein [Curvibacter sp. HBC28]MDD0817210.1 phage tail tube protein [Curvibacter sp. HBC28]